MVLIDSTDLVIAQRVRSTRIVVEMLERPRRTIETIESAVCAHPQYTRRVFQNRRNNVLAEARGVGWIVPIVTKILYIAVEAVEPAAIGTHPQVPITVYVQTFYPGVREGDSIIRTVYERCYLVAVVSVETSPGAEPHVSLVVLHHTCDIIPVSTTRQIDSVKSDMPCLSVYVRNEAEECQKKRRTFDRNTHDSGLIDVGGAKGNSSSSHRTDKYLCSPILRYGKDITSLVRNVNIVKKRT